MYRAGEECPKLGTKEHFTSDNPGSEMLEGR
jgi:hypothetical protein